MSRPPQPQRGTTLQRERMKPPADQPWAWIPRDVLESFAWRSLSDNARRVIDRVLVEHMAHGGWENGALPVTFSDLAGYGIRRNSIWPAIAECEALGLLERAEGFRVRGEFRGLAQRFRIAWMWTADGEPPSLRWAKFTTLEGARAAGASARRVGVDSRRSRLPTQDIDSSLASETRASNARETRKRA